MKNNRVIVGMSGGVDSAVTAAILHEAGYEVIGITMSVWEPETESQGTRTKGCCGVQEVEDAKRVASSLGFPHYVLNFRKIFQEQVITPFVEEYQRGRTPNPCVRCNEFIKFDYLLTKADEFEAAYVATGHYAKIEKDESRKRYLLRKADDSHKDQSYVLYPLSQRGLSRALMPLGSYSKDKTRSYAAELGLPVATKPDSQDICFIQQGSYRDFIQKRMPKLTPGKIVDESGAVLGEHPGIEFFTVGQRKGIGVARPEPLYVLAIDPDAGTVIVGDEKSLYRKRVRVSHVNWIAIDQLETPHRVTVKIRYQAQEAAATIAPRFIGASGNGDGQVNVEFDEPQRAPTPGQSIVFYDDDVVVGGGIIESSAA